MTYDPHSNDSMFSRVLTRLEEQDRAASETNARFLLLLTEIRVDAKDTKKRVESLETENAVTRGKIAVISFGVSGAVAVFGWAATVLFGK